MVVGSGNPEAPVATPKPKLLQQVRDAIRRKHFSPRTEESYVHWIKRFVFFHGKRHPLDLGEAQVTAFLNHLARDRGVAASTQNQALAALLFLYREVMARPLAWLDGLDRAKRPVRAPTVLTRAEVQSLLGTLESTRWIMAGLLYGAGLRLRECLKLRVKDVDFGYGQIMVRDGKGGERSRHDVARRGHRAVETAFDAGSGPPRQGSGGGLRRCRAAGCAAREISACGLRLELEVRFSVI